MAQSPLLISPESSSPRNSSQSYVYPVRSLLSGQIQPAPNQTPSIESNDRSPTRNDEHPDTLVPSAELLGGTPPFKPAYWTKDRTDAGTKYAERNETGFSSSDAYRGRHSTSSRSLSLSSQPITRLDAMDDDSSSTGLRPSLSAPSMLNRHRYTQSNTPNFRHYPAEENNSYLPRSFSSRLSDIILPSLPLELADVQTLHFDGPSSTSTLHRPNEASRSSSPNPVGAVPADPLLPSFMPSVTKEALPFNPSEYGIVHLPPINVPLAPSSGQVESDFHGRSQVVPPRVLRGRATPPVSGSSSKSEYFTPSDRSHTSIEHPVNFRYEHAQDENGNHIVIGREGQLERCEDEPIRTPGAVQAFGVLIAVQEKQDALIVRQVSENSTELLGLSPRFLFSLECFTDTLPESQADLLWDNIQFLNHPDYTFEDDASPHVFLLSGWGAPGTASQDTNNGHREWTCWCAIHRSAVTDPSSESSSLIVMEFEWERDILNPLHILEPEKTAPPIFFSSTVSSPQSNSTNTSEQIPSDSDMERLALSSTFNAHPTTDGIQSSMPVSTPTDDSTRTTRATTGTYVAPETGLDGQEDWLPSPEAIIESTTNYAKPLPALERLRRLKGASVHSSSEDAHPPSSPSSRRSQRRKKITRDVSIGVGMMDVFAIMSQINEQLGAATTLDILLKIVVGVIQDLTQFHRVMVYQFDEAWNGQVVAELVDWNQTTDLYQGLHFPATDIPAQARALYALNKVRLLYDRSQPTARIIVKSKEDLAVPLNMSYCYLRAMSPIHIQYLANMGVRASMSISIMAFGTLWGLVTCHSYGAHGMRVSFPVRQMLRLLSQSISRNIERLNYAQRLHTRRIINTMVNDRHPTGYIVSNADDLLGLFDADFGILVIGEGAKILGPNQHGQEILIMAEYLRLKQYTTIQASQAVNRDFPDLQLTAGFQVIAGLLLVPLSSIGTDFIAFLRKGQPKEVKWAGKPYKDGLEEGATLEPRKSFKIWSEIIAGRCRTWTDEQLETAGVLALVYGKFIEVWRQKENVRQTTKLTNILLSNASHEVRTPLNHIINYLEMALNGPLDAEARENLSRSHAASKSLLFTINDLLDLTRLESGNETSFNEPFDLRETIEKATYLYRKEAERRDISFDLQLEDSPRIVIGDAKKIRTVVQNLSANSLNYTSKGSITVCCTTFGEPEGLRGPQQMAVEILVADTGCGIPPDKLEHIFREFEQVESSGPKVGEDSGVGLGLAVVSRIVEQLGGQLRVESTVDQGSRFSFLIPLTLPADDPVPELLSSGSSDAPFGTHTRPSSHAEEIENLVEALAIYSSAVSSPQSGNSPPLLSAGARSVEVVGPLKPLKVDSLDMDLKSMIRRPPQSPAPNPTSAAASAAAMAGDAKLRILIVEDNEINRAILAKRLRVNNHIVVNTTNGQEGLDMIKSDRSFDLVLMDIQMPILNGFESTQKIRGFEKAEPLIVPTRRLSHELNGRIPIFAVSASLREVQHDELLEYGMDGWILKPIDFHRLNDILRGVTDPLQRQEDLYQLGCSWERGGWLRK